MGCWLAGARGCLATEESLGVSGADRYRIGCVFCFYFRFVDFFGKTAYAYDGRNPFVVFVFSASGRIDHLCPLEIQMDSYVQFYTCLCIYLHQSV